MTLFGVTLGIALGLFSSGALTASGFTSADLPPLVAPTSTPTPTTQPTTEPTREPGPAETGPKPELQKVSGNNAAPGERFPIVGRLPKSKDGQSLLIQIRDDDDSPWDEFPVQLTASDGGRFETKIWTSRTGERTIRVTDPDTKESTPEIKVTIG